MDFSLNLLTQLDTIACVYPKRFALTFESAQGTISLTYHELVERSKKVAAYFQQFTNYRGERALIVLPSGLDYIVVFLGCLYAQVIAVPAYPPRNLKRFKRIDSILKSARPEFVVTTARLSSKFSEQKVLTVDNLQDISSASYCSEYISLDDIAFLQYTSGSVSEPKGVVLSHNNILANIKTISSVLNDPNNSSCGMWLPPFHDMGLIGGILSTLYQGSQLYFMSPEYFLQSPIRWLQLLSKYQTPITVTPPFALDLCTYHISEEHKSEIDLSNLKLMYVGAEPIREEVLNRFSQAFGSCGFASTTYYPCYGLAEATLMVSGGFYTESLKLNFECKTQVNSVATVTMSCGTWNQDHTVKIVDPNTYKVLPDKTSGEIWVSGPSVANGYWNSAELTQNVFYQTLPDCNQLYMRTGDLGYISQKSLWVTGRIKDLLIIGGKKYFAHDLEFDLKQKFSSQGLLEIVVIKLNKAQDLLLVFIEVKRTKIKTIDYQNWGVNIYQYLFKLHQLKIDKILFLTPSSLPKTSSGKKQRYLVREAYLNNTFKYISDWSSALVDNTHNIKSSFDKKQLWLLDWLSLHSMQFLDEKALDQPLDSLGFSSLSIVELQKDYNKQFNQKLTVSYLDTPNQILKNFDLLSGHSIESTRILEPAKNFKELQSFLFKINEGVANNWTKIDGKLYSNFSSYNYLGLSGDPRVNQAVIEAIEEYGTSVSASRLVSGEKVLHQQLEVAIAALIGTEQSIVLPSGYGTNIAILTHFFNHNDLILYDEKIHNSILQGARYSSAKCLSYPHQQSSDFLSIYLSKHRQKFRKVLLVTEGVFSMDGDIPNIPELIKIKNHFNTELMIDEAHSIGVLGSTGGGVREYFNLSANDIDYWMGTLSKSFASCGGYLAGSHEKIENFKYFANGFVYSAGISPANTASALAAIRLMQNEPWRMVSLRENHRWLLEHLKKFGVDTGLSGGTPIIPLMVRQDEFAMELSRSFMDHNILALPVVYPAVENGGARVRLFINALHDRRQLEEILFYACEKLLVLQA